MKREPGVNPGQYPLLYTPTVPWQPCHCFDNYRDGKAPGRRSQKTCHSCQQLLNVRVKHLNMENLAKFYVFLPVLALSAGLLRAEGADSIRFVALNEVKVVQHRGVFYGEDHHVISINTSGNESYGTASLGEMLSLRFPSNIKTYGGTGNLASASVRGTSSVHTQINWNGFPVNNATTGDADLSLLPLLMADRISLVRGASASLYGSGTFGGAIDITSETYSKHRFGVSYTNETGSFGSHGNIMELHGGGSIFRYKGGVYSREAVNDFSYYDPLLAGSPRRIMQHNELSSWGTMHQLSITLPKGNRLEAGGWYQDKQKRLPEILGSLGNGLAEQSDSSLKVFLKFSHTSPKSSLILKSAWFSDHLRYTDRLSADDPRYLVYSVFHVKQLLSDIDYRYSFGGKLVVDAALITSKVFAEVENYGKSVEELRLAGLLAAKLKVGRLIVNNSLRLERMPAGGLVALPSFGAKWNPFITDIALHFNLSRKFRQPTLNEKYWTPGGNPSIKPEDGWGSELGLTFSPGLSGSHSLSLDLTGYSTFINNYILWTGEGTLLSPQNLENIWSRGLEADFVHEFTLHQAKISSTIDYMFTRSTIVKNSEDPMLIGSQLRYVPLHAGSVSTSLERKWLSLGVALSWSGERSSSELSSASVLSPYLLTSPWAGTNLDWQNLHCDLRIQVYNLFNQSYQVMVAYPMPGRFVSVSARITYLR
jgi:vitamin B12 transporter